MARKGDNLIKLAASLICADLLNFKKEVFLLDKSEVDFIHFDVMDGLFVPRFGLYPEILEATRKITKIPIEVHMMVENPELYIPIFARAGANIITVHPENNSNLLRTINLIHRLHMGVGIALNPATPINVLDYSLGVIEMVLVMGINPGILGQKMIAGTLKKIADIRNILPQNSDILLSVDGGVTFETAPEMIKNGANMLVCGSSTIFNQKEPIDKMVFRLRRTLNITN